MSPPASRFAAIMSAAMTLDTPAYTPAVVMHGTPATARGGVSRLGRLRVVRVVADVQVRDARGDRGVHDRVTVAAALERARAVHDEVHARDRGGDGAGVRQIEFREVRDAAQAGDCLSIASAAAASERPASTTFATDGSLATSAAAEAAPTRPVPPTNTTFLVASVSEASASDARARRSTAVRGSRDLRER